MVAAGTYVLWENQYFACLTGGNNACGGQSSAATSPAHDAFAACGALPNGSLQNVVETTRLFINLPRKDYLVSDSADDRSFQFVTASGTATALYISNGGPWGEGFDATPACWSTYFEFDGNGEVDLKVKSAVNGAPDYLVRFLVKGSPPEPVLTFRGTIQAVDDTSANVLYLEVNGKWISVWKSVPPDSHEGATAGLDFVHVQNNVGKTVDVFAESTNGPDTSHLTIFGDTKYYVRVAE